MISQELVRSTVAVACEYGYGEHTLLCGVLEQDEIPHLPVSRSNTDRLYHSSVAPKSSFTYITIVVHDMPRTSLSGARARHWLCYCGMPLPRWLESYETGPLFFWVLHGGYELSYCASHPGQGKNNELHMYMWVTLMRDNLIVHGT